MVYIPIGALHGETGGNPVRARRRDMRNITLIISYRKRKTDHWATEKVFKELHRVEIPGSVNLLCIFPRAPEKRAEKELKYTFVRRERNDKEIFKEDPLIPKRKSISSLVKAKSILP